MASILSLALDVRRRAPPHPPSTRTAPAPSRHMVSCQCRSPLFLSLFPFTPPPPRLTLTISAVARQSALRTVHPINSRVSSRHSPRPRACGSVTMNGISTYRPRIPSPGAGLITAAAKSCASSRPRRQATSKGLGFGRSVRRVSSSTDRFSSGNMARRSESTSFGSTAAAMASRSPSVNSATAQHEKTNRPPRRFVSSTVFSRSFCKDEPGAPRLTRRTSAGPRVGGGGSGFRCEGRKGGGCGQSISSTATPKGRRARSFGRSFGSPRGFPRVPIGFLSDSAKPPLPPPPASAGRVVSRRSRTSAGDRNRRGRGGGNAQFALGDSPGFRLAGVPGTPLRASAARSHSARPLSMDSHSCRSSAEAPFLTSGDAVSALIWSLAATTALSSRF